MNRKNLIYGIIGILIVMIVFGVIVIKGGSGQTETVVGQNIEQGVGYKTTFFRGLCDDYDSYYGGESFIVESDIKYKDVKLLEGYTISTLTYKSNITLENITYSETKQLGARMDLMNNSNARFIVRCFFALNTTDTQYGFARVTI